MFIFCVFLMKTTSWPFTENLYKTPEKANDIESVIWFPASAQSPVTFSRVTSFVRALLCEVGSCYGAAKPNMAVQQSTTSKQELILLPAVAVGEYWVDIISWQNSFIGKSSIHLITMILPLKPNHQSWKNQYSLWTVCHVINDSDLCGVKPKIESTGK